MEVFPAWNPAKQQTCQAIHGREWWRQCGWRKWSCWWWNGEKNAEKWRKKHRWRLSVCGEKYKWKTLNNTKSSQIYEMHGMTYDGCMRGWRGTTGRWLGRQRWVNRSGSFDHGGDQRRRVSRRAMDGGPGVRQRRVIERATLMSDDCRMGDQRSNG